MPDPATRTETRPLAFVRLPEVLRRLAQGRSTTLRRIAAGLFPPPIKLGANCVAWPEHEIDAVCAALLAGKGEPELRELVRQLVAARAAA